MANLGNKMALVSSHDVIIMVEEHVFMDSVVCVGCKGGRTHPVYTYRNPFPDPFRGGIISIWHYENCLTCKGKGYWRTYEY